MVLGVVASVGWTTERWPRFLSQGVHRNLSLFCVGFVALHVVTTVSDGYVPIGFADAFVPFLTPYRPLWVGLGALAFDLLLVVLVTSALRHRIGYDSWRFVHWLAYLCWPIAMFHSLGSGSDSSLPFALGLDAACTAAVLAAVAWRVGTGRTFGAGLRVGRRGGSGGCCRCHGRVRRRRSPAPRVVAPGRHLGRPPRPTGRQERYRPVDPLVRVGRSERRAGGPVHLRPDRVPDHIGPRRPWAGARHPVPAAAGSLVYLAHRDPRRDPGPGWWDRHDLGLGGLRRLPRDGHLAGRRHRGGCDVRPPLGDPDTHPQDRRQLGCPVRHRDRDQFVTPPASLGGLRSSTDTVPLRPSVAAPSGSVRLLAGVAASGRPVGLDEHLERWGALPHWKGETFIEELERSGLRGRGGGWFPVGTKWRAVHRVGVRRPVVVANGSESEPASGKDRLLLCQLPHLVLDGAVVAARTIGAPDIVVHVPGFARPAVERALAERRRRGLDPCTIEVVTAPDRYLAGQESAVVNTISGQNPGIPSFVGLRSVRERGVRGRPTLVQNVESLAHASLIARFGAQWFRSVGTQESPRLHPADRHRPVARTQHYRGIPRAPVGRRPRLGPLGGALGTRGPPRGVRRCLAVHC